MSQRIDVCVASLAEGTCDSLCVGGLQKSLSLWRCCESLISWAMTWCRGYLDGLKPFTRLSSEWFTSGLVFRTMVFVRIAPHAKKGGPTIDMILVGMYDIIASHLDEIRSHA